MKICILYCFEGGPWGGANQFLKALRQYLIKKGLYTDYLNEADVVIMSGYPFRNEKFFKQIFKLKKKHPGKIVIHRRDGPISLIRGHHKVLDRILTQFCRIAMDGIIFQSHWCHDQNKELFKMTAPHQVVIHNAPDNTLFHPAPKKQLDGKIKLIANSWSSNWRKGFDVYQYLDEHLDFSKYEMTFVGNSPIPFKNIKHLDPVDSKKLAAILRGHDIYITASRTDPCSNSLIEALSSSLPAVVYNDGGHPELVQKGGEVFDDIEKVIPMIEKVAQNYDHYQNTLPQFPFEKAGEEYLKFIQNIHDQVGRGVYQPKQIHLEQHLKFAYMMVSVWSFKLKGLLLAIPKKILKK